jgi:glycosyltransferase involved in cell wall biosynthesis
MLEIIIITNNRLEKLKETLACIKNSFLSDFKITILDNCSTDGTTEYLTNLSANQKNIKLIVNVINIGAAANVMRAYEIASAQYLWLMCDDDNYDFSENNNFINILEIDKPDVLVVGSPFDINNSVLYGYSKVGKLLPSNDFKFSKLPLTLTFIPSSILKVDKIKKCNFDIGYQLINTHFLHFFWISELMNDNWSLYIFNINLITRPLVGNGLNSNITHVNGYMEAVSRTIINKASNKYLKYSYFDNRYNNYFIMLAKMMLLDKLNRKLSYSEYKRHLMLSEGFYLMYALFLVIVFLVPNKLILKIKNFYNRWRN